jgi:hypothetical protein
MGCGKALYIGTLSGISIALILLLITAGSTLHFLPNLYFLRVSLPYLPSNRMLARSLRTDWRKTYIYCIKLLKLGYIVWKPLESAIPSLSTNTQLTNLQITTTSLSFSSALSNSTFLAGLSTLTGTDLVGKPASASTLGLASTYSLAILATCANGSNGTTCTPLQYGHNFDFASGLKLDPNEGLSQALDQYKITAVFLGVGYLVAKLLTLMAAVTFILFGSRGKRWGAILASIFSLLASVLVIAAAGAAMATFTKLDKDLRAAYESIGLKEI